MFSCIVFVMLFVRLIMFALWLPAGKALTSWLSFLTFPMVSLVRCGT